jgi:hypothetical protein
MFTDVPLDRKGNILWLEKSLLFSKLDGVSYNFGAACMINNIQTTLLLTKNDETQKTVDERIFEIVIFALKIGEKKQ